MRLIDADALIYELSRLCPIDFSDVEDYMGIKIDGEMLDKGDVLYVIDNTPTIDPVKHGRWKKTYLDHEAIGERPSIFYCSVCNQCIAYPVNYCPSCGADMRGAEND